MAHMMSVQSSVPGDELAGALKSLGVRFLLGGKAGPTRLSPDRLITSLAGSDEARLRLALIPLFLERPEFAVHVRPAADRLAGHARLTLQCYYTAAMLLQQLNRTQINAHLDEQVPLPDFFSQDLEIPEEGEPDLRLEELARRHQALSEVSANWLGTYRHAAEIWLKGLDFSKDLA